MQRQNWCLSIMQEEKNNEILKKLLRKSQDFDTAVILVSNGHKDSYGKYEVMAGFGADKVFTHPKQISNEDQSLKFGIIPYSFRKQMYVSKSAHEDRFQWPDFYFFKPVEYYCEQRDGSIQASFDINEINEIITEKGDVQPLFNFESDIDQRAYLENISHIRNKIEEGDFYEMNYCISFTANESVLDPEKLFLDYNTITQSPFAAFFKLGGNNYLLCASPERFLKKTNKQLVSQPIKGTRRRILSNKELDDFQAEELKSCIKERAENVMITDLVRNDLSRISTPGSVVVPELFGIYSFSHVHQMISTISSELKPGITFQEILEATFPMGSMTGAPKQEVIKNIEALEGFERGLYSGCIGYMENADFDFNVIIRSIQYNRKLGITGFHVGGAITYDSVALKEYEECMNKAAGMLDVLKSISKK